MSDPPPTSRSEVPDRPLDVGTVTIAPDHLAPGTPQVPPSPPLRIGRFEVRRFLGAGSFGRVYEAFDPTLQRLVALKVARPEQLFNEHRVERFHREARAAGLLMHPHIVAVFDSGQDGPHHYIACAFVPGRSLAAELASLPDGQTLPLRQAIGIVRKLAEALALAHRSGIVHRDVKPSNVLLRDDGEPMLTDFGLARLDDQEHLTRSDPALGTPAYTAPEQWLGKAEAASDQYSLGCVLFELLTGQVPFGGSSPEHYLLLHTHQAAPSPRAVRPGLSRDLETITLKCLQKEPGRRYPGCQELADDLRRWLDGEPIQARRAGRAERAWRWARKNPALAAALSALVVMAALGGSLVAWQWQKAVAARRDRALAQVGALGSASPAEVPAILARLEDRDEEVRRSLHEEYHASERGSQRRLRLALALVPGEPRTVLDELADWMVEAPDPAEVLLVRRVLQDHANELKDRLWHQTQDALPARRLRALVALAAFDPDDRRWTKVAPDAVEGLVTADPWHLGTWAEALRPVRSALLAPLGEVFRGKRLAEQKQVAARVLADYAADRPEVLADLLLDADPGQYAVLAPVLQRHRERAAELMRRELARLPDYWKDDPLARRWTAAPEALQREVERSGGLFAERFALCQALPPGRLQAVTEGLRPAGYRPVRVRPWQEGAEVRVAVVWTRDRRDWRLETGLAVDQVQARNEVAEKAKLVAADLASYHTRAGIRYAVLWRQGDAGEQVRITAGRPPGEHSQGMERFRQAGFVLQTVQQLTEPDGVVRYAAVWRQGQPQPPSWTGHAAIDQTHHAIRGRAGERLAVDVDVGPVPTLLPPPKQWEATVLQQSRVLAAHPDNVVALHHRAGALFHLKRDAEALVDLDALAGKGWTLAWGVRALLHARAGRAEAARRDLAEFARRSGDRKLILGAAAGVGLYLGETTGLETLEAEATRTASPVLLGEAARAHALAWRLAAQRPAPDREALARHAQRALAFLKSGLQTGYLTLSPLLADPELAALPDQAAVRTLLVEAGAFRRYASVWHEDGTRQAEGLHGLGAEEHLARCRDLAARGFRPVALSLMRGPAERGPVAASVWHRPVLTPAEDRQRAVRQATSGATLLRLGEAAPAWPLWRHTPDPTVRSFLVQRARLLGVDPRLLVERLRQEKDASARAALILALGEYTAKELPPAVRRPLVPTLLRWYRDDPDPGVHGAIDWLLRHAREGRSARPLDWGQRSTLAGIDQALRRRDPDGKRRWYVNGQGQTMVVIQRPGEFRMGSPHSEPGRAADEAAHWRRIGRSYAIASRPVTRAQWERFQKDHPQVRLFRPNYPDATLDDPAVMLTWSEAALYCNWLSGKEGIPPEQWCYEDAGGMDVKSVPGYLHRKGYRLPTEAEWEHACRAGTTTSRPFGAADELLPRYAWYRDNSQDRTWPVGQKRPNDLGLFDMLGPAWNWCHDSPGAYFPRGPSVTGSVIEDREHGGDLTERALRGTGFDRRAAEVRSAAREHFRMAGRSATIGIRPARTCD
jgi:formylglycine-generating enzyme required for sulfatase activity